MDICIFELIIKKSVKIKNYNIDLKNALQLTSTTYTYSFNYVLH